MASKFSRHEKNSTSLLIHVTCRIFIETGLLALMEVIFLCYISIKIYFKLLDELFGSDIPNFFNHGVGHLFNRNPSVISRSIYCLSIVRFLSVGQALMCYSPLCILDGRKPMFAMASPRSILLLFFFSSACVCFFSTESSHDFLLQRILWGENFNTDGFRCGLQSLAL